MPQTQGLPAGKIGQREENPFSRFTLIGACSISLVVRAPTSYHLDRSVLIDDRGQSRRPWTPRGGMALGGT